MKKYICVFFLLFIFGCGANDSGYSNYYSSYIGISSYYEKTKGSSNLTHGYKDPPAFDVNNPLAKFELENSLQVYLDGVVNDLKEIKDKADNANEKINVLVDAAMHDFGYFQWYFRYVGSVRRNPLKSKSNFELSYYPEFPDFDYPLFYPVKPSKPLYFENDFALGVYNDSVREYNREVADLAATVKDYIKDAEHYIENCNNDYELIRQKGLYVESLVINPKVSRYYTELEKRNADYKKVIETNTTRKSEVESSSGSTNSVIPKQSVPQESQVDNSNRKIIGYQTKTDTKTGKIVTYPVYENEQTK